MFVRSCSFNNNFIGSYKRHQCQVAATCMADDQEKKIRTIQLIIHTLCVYSSRSRNTKSKWPFASCKSRSIRCSSSTILQNVLTTSLCFKESVCATPERNFSIYESVSYETGSRKIQSSSFQKCTYARHTQRPPRQQHTTYIVLPMQLKLMCCTYFVIYNSYAVIGLTQRQYQYQYQVSHF